MTKYILKSTGNEIKFGDNISCISRKGNTISKFCGIFNNDSIEFLVENDMIEIKYDFNIYHVLESLCKRFKLGDTECENFINTLIRISPMAFLSVMLKEISYIMDVRNKDNFKTYNKLYCVSSKDLSILEIDPSDKSIIWDNIAFFRTEEEAKNALNIIFKYDKVKD